MLVGDPFAPTAVRDPGKAIEDHIADALVALELPQVRAASSIADLGAGAGVPGLPLAISLPAAQVYLVESNARKCEFLARTIAACAVPNAHVVHVRAECWTDGLGVCGVVTARALAAPAVVAEYAAPLLVIGGTAVAWQGRRDRCAELAVARAGDELGLEVAEPLAVQPYPKAEHRHLQLMLKVRETPSRFPRRPGFAVKRPLGGFGRERADGAR
ncbi:MAG: 16S rRNA (guanine(527)-N(7))-methyltransferase RsmG [Solirubrobacteraceae bacterium]